VCATGRADLGKNGDETEVETPTAASGAGFRICPFCEESRLVFSGLYEARCPACDHEPGEDSLKTLRQIVALPEASKTSRSRPERKLRVRKPDPKKENDEQKGASPEVE
jgi:hypothetical protein